ncbi:MAG: DUF1566 domain-containing protein [Deltaproteobacteria bacterium]|jgi:hypothetical protein|nr:DUF1566 domain-containing protein [Deltaproteobacteria bacterium]
MKKTGLFLIVSFTLIIGIILNWVSAPGVPEASQERQKKTAIVDTGQLKCYDNRGQIACPEPGQPFYGQDASYTANFPSYRDNHDGTVTDLSTGLMWSKAVEGDKVSLLEAKELAKQMALGGYTDWRVPNIKELYSLMDFRGNTGFSREGYHAGVPADAIPFINTDYFDFAYGDVKAGERYIDAQWLSSTQYVSTTVNGAATLFGVNFADGRIKGYGYIRPGSSKEKKFYVRFVRGNAYGKNDFVDHGDGTATDRSTGLMWMQEDSGKGMQWADALEYAEELVYAGYDDWRLPNAKELQYIVDYNRSPDTTQSAAIDSVFQTTSIVNEAGEVDYPYFWTSTTHLDGPEPGKNAAYIAFGRAIGKMHGRIMDVHGAGAQRSDPKTGRPTFRGPQGDAIRAGNYVRCVRGGAVKSKTGPPAENITGYPYDINIQGVVRSNNQKDSKSIAGPGHAGRKFVERLDANGDGRVSRSEFDGPKHRFKFHDQNNDGYLTEDEAPEGPRPTRRRLPGTSE